MGGRDDRRPNMPPETFDRIKPRTRELSLVPDSVKEKERTCEYTLATEAPVRAWSWRHGEFDEILLCAAENVDTGRLDSGNCPFLAGHNRWDLDAKVGTITGYRFEERQLVITVRFDETEAAEKVWERVQRGELRSCSVGYAVREYEVTEREDGPDERRATRWEPYEGSIVTVPADHAAAARGAASVENQEVEVRLVRAGETNMDEDEIENTENTQAEGGQRDSSPEPQEAEGAGGRGQPLCGGWCAPRRPSHQSAGE